MIEEREGEGSGCFVVTVPLKLVVLVAALLSLAGLKSTVVRQDLA